MNSSILRLLDMHTLKNYIYLFSLLIFCAFSNDGWELVKSENNIQVYTKKSQSSDFDIVKVETKVEAKLSQVVAVLDDLDAQKKWVYGTKGLNLIERKSDTECEYHYYMKMPFPVKDRDVIINYSRVQDADTKVVTTVSKSIRKEDLISDDYKRIRSFQSTYTLTPNDDGTIGIVYILEADPGSNLPSWLINMFTTSGPYKSMDGLIKMINKSEYKNAIVPSLTN